MGDSSSIQGKMSFMHAFQCKTPNSERTRKLKDMACQIAVCGGDSRSSKRRAAMKRRKLDELDSIKECREKKISKNYLEANRIFFSGHRNHFSALREDDKLFLVKDKLKIIDTIHGCDLANDDGALVFRLVPREAALQAMGKSMIKNAEVSFSALFCNQVLNCRWKGVPILHLSAGVFRG